MLSLGLEIGGTKLQAGVGTGAEATLRSLVRTGVDAAQGAEGVRRAVGPLVERALLAAGCTLADIERVGIGFGGPLDSRRGVTLRSFQIEGWDEFPLRAWAEAQWGKPTRVQNDASAAALAEARHGAGRGCARLFYMTIGSGIGGGWLDGGRLDEGQGLGAAEIGHIWLPQPDTGEPVELEQLCSGWAIGRRAQAVAATEPTLMTELAGGLAGIDAQTVYAAAEQGDLPALRLLDETCWALGLALGNVVALLHPERIVIGGGVSLMGPLFWERLRREVQRWGLSLFTPTVDIAPAALGEAVVVIGALSL